MKLPSRIGLLALLGVALAIGCSGGDDFVGTSQQDLAAANGVVDPATVGIVQFVNSEGLCSGTLVRNDWVLTAEHCWTGGWEEVSGVTVTMGDQTVAAAKGFPVSIGGQIDTTIDALLVLLAQPFTMNGTTTGWKRGLTSAKKLIPSQAPVTCWGYGLNDAGKVDHLLRFTTDERLVGLNGSNLAVLARGGGPHIQGGDSGGPCLYVDGTIVGTIHGQVPVVGSTNDDCLSADKASDPKLCDDTITATDAFSDWFSQTISDYTRGEPINEEGNPISRLFPLSTVHLETPGGTPCTGEILTSTSKSASILTAAHCKVTSATQVYFYPTTKGGGSQPIMSSVISASPTAPIAIQDGVVCDPAVAGSFPDTCYSNIGSGRHYADLAVLTLASTIPAPYRAVALGAPGSFGPLHARQSWAVASGGRSMQWAPTYEPAASDSLGSFTMQAPFAFIGDAGGSLYQKASGSVPNAGTYNLVLLGVTSNMGPCLGAVCDAHLETYASVVHPDNYNWLVAQGGSTKPNYATFGAGL